jgi:hypothetical protein
LHGLIPAIPLELLFRLKPPLELLFRLKPLPEFMFFNPMFFRIKKY